MWARTFSLLFLKLRRMLHLHHLEENPLAYPHSSTATFSLASPFASYWQKALWQKRSGRVADRARPAEVSSLNRQSESAASAEAAIAPCKAAGAAGGAGGAAATTADPKATTAATATATPAAATPAAAGSHLQEWAGLGLSVEKIECRQTHIGDFLFAECDRLGWHKAQLLW
jgi:hypothetical protein